MVTPRAVPRARATGAPILRNGLLKEVPAILKTLAANAKGGDTQAARLLPERTLPALGVYTSLDAQLVPGKGMLVLAHAANLTCSR